ncbi:SCAN domain-containing protein 3-like [Aphis gossypii]|uniref:SCAN domain-containing protein 3-like n=1 Tax=Aphis gossypii TaxID=80765 RepID=UPI002158E9BA|nr:SCAN domain-containing protein 3-like [Aphis gossypii]
MTNLWPECKIIHGRPRYPQSQGSIERCNQDVENMLRAWMIDNQSTDWGMGCYFVQWQKNCSKHRIINRSPYKALFGSEPKIGFSSKNLPNDILQPITTEEDLNELINTEVSDEVDSDEEAEDMSIINKESLCDTCVKEKKIQNERVEAFKGQKKAAKKMIQTSDKKLVVIEVGNYVLVNIPKTTDAEFLDEVPDTMLTLREIAKRHSQFGGQGYQKCFCKTSCKTNRCACRKNNVLCSSRCHEKTTCNNK